MFEGFLAPSHILIVAIIALLLFGDRLPEVMRSVGKGVAEFKKGLRGIESAMEAASTTPSNANRTATNETVSTPRFDPPTSEPIAIENSAPTESSATDPAHHA
jgi:sec-independent protein translocase protein TatA